MKARIWLASLFLAGVSLALTVGGASAAGYPCPPTTALRQPARCNGSGPEGALVSLARQGLYPARPLPTLGLHPWMGHVPFEYLRVTRDSVSLFPSAKAAKQGTGAIGRTQPGFVYLSATETVDGEGGIVYRTQQGYVRGDGVSRVTLPTFQGLAFRRTPDRPFGWVTSGGLCSRAAPGAAAPATGRCYVKYHVVQIHDRAQVDGQEWLRIGMEEWVEADYVGEVVPDPTPPEGVDGRRWVSVNLAEQTVAAYEDGRLVFATLASTGRYGFWTQPGLFQVWIKLERDNMTGGLDEGYYYLEDVPWVIYFDQARALHGTYWHNKFGTPTSRGCVNLTPADAKWFFDFVEEGTWVYVFDPTGQTPTDPSLYGPGGA